MLHSSDSTSAEPRSRVRRVLQIVKGGLPANAFDRNNAVAVFLMGVLPAIGGSAISFLLNIFFVWAVISVILRRFPFRMSRSDQFIAGAFTLFVFAEIMTGLLADDRLLLWTKSVWLLPFLSLWVMIPRLRASSHLDYLKIYIIGAGVGSVGAGIVALIWVSLGFVRPAGGAGNPIVFAQMSLLLASIAALGIVSPQSRLRWLAVGSMIGGLVALALSLSRGVWLAAIPVAAVLYRYARPQWRTLIRHPHFWLAAAAIGIVAVWMISFTDRYIAYTLTALVHIYSGGPADQSIGERLHLWAAAWTALTDSPLWGYGMQNRMQALYAHYPKDLTAGGFSHPHNGYLALMLDGGLIVLGAGLAMLIAPVIAAWRAPRDAAHRRRFFLALVVTAAYAGTAMSEILFKHDILDSFYIFNTILIAASIPGPREREEPGVRASQPDTASEEIKVHGAHSRQRSGS